MAVVGPPASVLAAILGPSSRITRRIEIFESDGKTRWSGDDGEIRLIEGSVAVEYDRPERRSVELTLDNSDGKLRHNPDGFWYDKVLKIFKGVDVREPTRSPRILIIEDEGSISALPLRQTLAGAGFTDITIRPSVTTSTQLVGYDIVVSMAATVANAKSALIRQYWAAGGRVFTVGPWATSATFPEIIASTVSKPEGTAFMLAPIYSAHPVTSGWLTEQQSSQNALVPSGLAVGAVAIAGWSMGATQVYSAIARENQNGGRWVHLQNNDLSGPETRKFLRRVFTWINPVIPINVWEVQIGEFLIDRIAEDHFPRHLKITGRDYAKKCLLSKFPTTTAFAANLKPEDVIKTIALNAGITKFTMPITGMTLGKDTFFERETDRWTAMSEIAEAFSYELFFDATGYLVMRPFRDPLTSPISLTLETGKYGNLVSYSKASSDTSLFNHIVVTGESADSEVPAVWAEAINNNPASPTRVEKIGQRTLLVASALITTHAQAQTLADQYLKIRAMEEFELDFSIIALAWLEVGEIIRFLDPRRAPGEPDRFLLTSLSLGLGLGPMSGNAKRVTVVG